MLFIGLSSLLITLNHAPWSRSHLSWAVQAWWELLIKQTWSLELRSRSLRLESQAPMRNVLQSPRHLERRTQARLMLDSRCVASVLLASLGHQSSELTQLREAWGERWLRAPASSQEHQPRLYTDSGHRAHCIHWSLDRIWDFVIYFFETWVSKKWISKSENHSAGLIEGDTATGDGSW